MTPDRLRAVREVYEAADEAPEAERTALLDRLCAGDPDLRQTVEALLAPDEPATDPIARAIGESASDFFETVREPEPGAPRERIGRYEIVRRIGQGGMGAVFEATRIDDFRKRVALKIIRGELDSDASRRRFEQERQLLANLEHPYIARLIDGGETPRGSPYLVLEYVDGEALLDRAARLSRPAVLRLFLKVCEAVEYAHRNLIIHRDLKPSNILVTADGDPKLLDFGIATLIQSDALGGEDDVAALTLGFASPEAVLGKPMTTAADVYSLGVVLYRLLTGRMPCALDSADPEQAERTICVQPPAPAGLGDECDDILAKTLRKDPEQRYAGARDLAEDIRRYLDHLPVGARGGGLGYRARKFVRRRWPALTVAAALAATVVAGVGATVYQAEVAQGRFDQLRRLAHSFVFDYGDDLAKVEGTTAVRERMVGAALTYLGALSRDARGDVRLQRELAGAYAKVGDTQGNPAGANLGHVDQALASYAKAAALYDRVVAHDPSAAGEAGEFYVDYAKLLILANDRPASARASAAAFRDLDLTQRSAPGDADNQARVAHAWCVLGDAAQSPPLQLAEYHRCNLISQAVLARRPGWESEKLHIGALIRDAGDMSDVGRMDDAVVALADEQRLLDAALASHPHEPELRKRETMLAQIRSRVAYDDMGPSLNDPAAGVVYARRYLDLARRGVERDGANAASRFSLAVGLFRLSFPLKVSDPAAAIASARESVAVFDGIVADGHASPLVISRHARAERRLGEALLFAGRTDEAASWIAKALAEHQRAAAATPSDFDESANLVIALIDARRVADAQADRLRALAFLTRAEAAAVAIVRADAHNLPAVVLVARARQELAEHWRTAGDVARADAWTAAAKQAWRDFPDQNAWVRRMAASNAPLPR